MGAYSRLGANSRLGAYSNKYGTIMLFVCHPKFCINIVVVSLGAILTPKRN